jgi:hypothetical protein
VILDVLQDCWALAARILPRGPLLHSSLDGKATAAVKPCSTACRTHCTPRRLRNPTMKVRCRATLPPRMLHRGRENHIPMNCPSHVSRTFFMPPGKPGSAPCPCSGSLAGRPSRHFSVAITSTQGKLESNNIAWKTRRANTLPLVTRHAAR